VRGASRSSTPPWFDIELNGLGAWYYESAGFEVVYSSPCGLASDQKKITPSDLHAWVSEQVSSTATEAIVFGGNGFRTVGAISALEEDLGRAVVTANQALLWAALRVVGADVGSVSGYGRVFGHG
jgi:maleate isomerase